MHTKIIYRHVLKIFCTDRDEVKKQGAVCPTHTGYKNQTFLKRSIQRKTQLFPLDINRHENLSGRCHFTSRIEME